GTALRVRIGTSRACKFAQAPGAPRSPDALVSASRVPDGAAPRGRTAHGEQRASELERHGPLLVLRGAASPHRHLAGAVRGAEAGGPGGEQGPIAIRRDGAAAPRRRLL